MALSPALSKAIEAAQSKFPANLALTALSRKQFNSFLYVLYKCEGQNNVKADIIYEGEDYYVEVFLDSPDGLMIAVHHNFRGFNYQSVDVLRPSMDAPVEKAA